MDNNGEHREFDSIESSEIKKNHAEIQLKKAKAEFEIEQLNFACVQAENKLEKIQAHIREKGDDLSFHQQKLDTLQGQILGARKELEDSVAQVEREKSQLHHLEKKCQAQVSELQSIEESSGVARQKQDELMVEIERLKNLVQKEKDNHDHYVEAVCDQKEGLREASSQCHIVKKRVLAKKKEIQALKKQIFDLEASKATLSADIEEKVQEAADQVTKMKLAAENEAQLTIKAAESNAKQMMSDKQRLAEQFYQEKVADAEMESARVLEKAKNEYVAKSHSADDLVKKMIEEAERDADQNKKSCQLAYERIVELGQKEAKEIREKAQMLASELTEQAKVEKERLKNEGLEQSKTLLEQAHEEATRVRAGIENEKQHLSCELEEFRKDCEREKHDLEVALAEDRDKIRKRHATEIGQQEQAWQKEKEKIHTGFDNFKSQLEGEKKKLLEDKNKEIRHIESEAEKKNAKAQQLLHETQKEIESRLRQWEAHQTAAKRAFEEGIKKEKEGLLHALQTQIQEAKEERVRLRERTEREQAKRQADFENEIRAKRLHHDQSFDKLFALEKERIIDTISDSLGESLRERRAGDLSPEHTESGIRSAIDKALCEARVRQNQKFSDSQSIKLEKDSFKGGSYWWAKSLRTSIWIVLSLVGLGIVWKSLSVYLPDRQLSAATKFVEKVQVKKERQAYLPEKTAVFKGSYTDNLLYTRDFLPTEKNKKSRDQWIIQLSRYAVRHLDLGHQQVVQLLAKEASLLKQLEKSRKVIDKRDIAAGVERMRDIEKRYKRELVAILGGDTQYKAFWRFKGEFFSKVPK